MPDEPSRELDDRIDQYRAEDEPADDWQPVTPRYGPGLGMEVAPTDLDHFSRMLTADQEAFDQSARDADTERGIYFPNFAGFAAEGMAELEGGSAGAMPEGMAFMRTYLDSYISLRALLAEASAGLTMLGAAATSIDVHYRLADGFGLADPGNPFSPESGYHVDLVRSAFNTDDTTVEVDRDEALSDQAEAGWSEALRGADATEAGVTGVPAVLVGDADPRPGGEHAPAPDQDAVVSNTGAQDYGASAPEYPGDITLGRDD